MRKDVKLGLSVGSVLFAVIIIYLVVASHKNKNTGADVADIGDPAGAVDSGSTDGGTPPIKTEVVPPPPAPHHDTADLPRGGSAIPPPPEGGSKWPKLFSESESQADPLVNLHHPEDKKADNLKPPATNGGNVASSGNVVTPKPLDETAQPLRERTSSRPAKAFRRLHGLPMAGLRITR